MGLFRDEALLEALGQYKNFLIAQRETRLALQARLHYEICYGHRSS